jgi:Uncharacterized oxidoreductases, Fe-dependent alcohol dehydrogenase family
MLDFTFYNPARIIFGKQSLSSLGEMLEKYDANCILLHYGGGAIKKNGIYEKVIGIIKESGKQFVELGGVMPNPRISLVREGIKMCHDNNVDFILAVGGGSVIDSAKAIAAGAKYNGDIWECFMESKRVDDAIQIGVVLTIPAAGSETSSGTVVTNEESGFKRYTGGECLIPRFAILNPEFTYTLPAYQTACGASDILAHLMERYFTNIKHVDLTDRLIEGTIKTILYNTPAALETPDNYDARAEIMWAGTLAHNNLLNTGRIGDWGSHDIGHEISAIYDLAHGASLSIIFPAWMKYVYKTNIDKFLQFAERIFGIELAYDDKDRIVHEMIKRLESFYRSIGLPVRLGEAGIGNDRLSEMAKKAMVGRKNVGQLLKLNYEDILQIYKLAL